MIPADKILENQYTTGNEFISLSTGKYYQGYYCIVLGSKYYEGKTYTIPLKELKKANSTFIPPPPVSLPPQPLTRYFIKKLNVFPIVIKEVNKQTYENFVNDLFYQTAIIDGEMIFRDSPELNKAEAQMSGLKAFLSA